MILTVEKEVLSRQVTVADNFFTRLKGLLGTRELPRGHALLITPCNSVHTFGMRYDIDVFFVSRTGEILKIVPSMPPGRLAWCRKSTFVLELWAGAAAEYCVCVGDHVQLSCDAVST